MRSLIREAFVGAGALLACFIAAPLSAATATKMTTACATLPSMFRAGRVFVVFPTLGGVTLSLFTDTGGGGSILTRDAAQRAGLTTNPPTAELAAELGPEALVAQPPAPAPRSGVPLLPAPLLVMPSIFPVPSWPETVDGMLGQNWFANRVWTWD